ncbi:uncharacterized protein LOC129946286 [Eupeodes corollae]|uniref:uncharacterized protein LOC129946286 n=1 Tax=Eupeodes corollae TaxID=290404 RepID=UPI002493B5A6|nr:uncharacterized protein LOC129946286 [Eupeodes corollae]
MSQDSTINGLLTRDDITSILNERHLKIPNIEFMGYEELLRIYETFAQPLEKRHSKQRCSAPENVIQVQPYPPAPEQPLAHDFHTKISLNEDFQMSRVVPTITPCSYDLHPTKYIKLSFNTLPSVAKKRSNGITINAAQEATPSKRKPITWP